MSDTERKMSPKGFLNKATKPNLSAAGFMAKYREYMTTGELAPILSPLVNKVDLAKAEALQAKQDTEELVKAGIAEIARAVMNHIIAVDIRKAEKSEEEAAQPAKKKNWTATIYNAKDEIQTRVNAKGEVEDLVKGFEVSGDADRWTDRRLALDGASDWYGVVQHTHSSVRVIVMRDDAMARIFKLPKGPAIHQTGKSTKSLGFGVKVKEDRSRFSHG